MISRSPFKLLRSVTNYRRLTTATATLKLPSERAQQVSCAVEGSPLYSVMIDKDVGCKLAGRDLGFDPVTVDLIFYGGCHFACDNGPKSPCLTLSHEVSSLLKFGNGAEVPAVLFHGGVNDGSAITLKGTEGEEMWAITAHGVRVLSKVLLAMK